jgi:hypothetical protein
MRIRTSMAVAALAASCVLVQPTVGAAATSASGAAAQQAATDALSASLLADATGMRVRAKLAPTVRVDEAAEWPPANDIHLLVFAACAILTTAAARRYSDRP